MGYVKDTRPREIITIDLGTCNDKKDAAVVR